MSAIIISLKYIHHALLLLTDNTPRKNITMSWSSVKSRKAAVELHGYIFAPPLGATAIREEERGHDNDNILVSIDSFGAAQFINCLYPLAFVHSFIRLFHLHYPLLSRLGPSCRLCAPSYHMRVVRGCLLLCIPVVIHPSTVDC